jgi:replicative DNA helicase
MKRGALGYFERLVAPKEKPLYLKTGWPSVDLALNGGFVPGQSVTAQGYTNVAKSNFLANLALNFVKADEPTILFSLEMSEDEMWARLFAIDGAVANIMQLDDAYYGVAPPIAGQVRAWEMTAKKMAALPLQIVDDCYTLPEIEAKAADLAAELGRARAVLIDYRDLIELGGEDRREGRFAVEAISRRLKLLAKRLNTTVIAVGACQRPAKGDDYHPKLESARESGRIEYDADVVILLARDVSAPETKRKLEYRVAKLRRGRAMNGFQPLRLNLATLKISDTPDAVGAAAAAVGEVMEDEAK